MESTQARLRLLQGLKNILEQKPEALLNAIERACAENPWFTPDSYQQMMASICDHFLDQEKLANFISLYPALQESKISYDVGLVMAGNLPLVGFHDVLCTFLTGHRSQLKLADKDQVVWPTILNLWYNLEPRLKEWIRVVDRLVNFEAVIATGSNQSARYFQLYFGRYPHLIRHNRSSLAILTGEETDEELTALGEDIFSYYGLGCRNVSSILVPKGYPIKKLLEHWKNYDYVIDNHKYKHNFDYHLATLIINNIQYFENGFIIVQENPQLASKVAVLHYQIYDNEVDLSKLLMEHEIQIQAVVSKSPYTGWTHHYFGTCQQPALNDYADRVDTMEFLLKLSK